MPPSRVLVIEDDTSLQREFAEIVRGGGHEVDTAQSKTEALEKLRCRTYHVALIDIMLTDDPSDRGGIACVESIVRLDEGTVPIILSASEDVRIPVEAWKKGALDYLIKSDIRGSQDIMNAVERGINACKLKPYGRFETLTGYLGYPMEGWAFEDSLIRILGGDVGRAHGALEKLFASLVPVLRQRNANYSSVVANTSTRKLEGMLWSKALGSAVWFALSAGNDDPTPPPADSGQAELVLDITETKLWRGRARVWRIATPRDSFDETLADSSPVKSRVQEDNITLDE